jgi:hypothetical protein
VAILTWIVVTRPAENDRRPGPPSPDLTTPLWFRDVTAASGVRFTYRGGQAAGHLTNLEQMGGGVALIDYDGDGLLDLFCTGGGGFSTSRQQYPEDVRQYLAALHRAAPKIEGSPCKLFRNRGNWTFEDVTDQVGLDISWPYTHGAAVADYDRDGWPDLLVTGFGRVILLHNEPDGKGGRRFVDVSEKVGLRDNGWCTSAAWADFDGDGWPDLYICHYLDWSFEKHALCPSDLSPTKHDTCQPQRFGAVSHALFKNEAGKSFRDVSKEVGFKAEGRGLGVLWVDVNDDGRPDAFVANDTNPNFLFVNRGNGRLDEVAFAAGVAMDDIGRFDGNMGVDAADFDGSGRPSIFVTTFDQEHHALFRNLGRDKLGRETFLHSTKAAGIAAIGTNWVGFGTVFADVDNDGWEDLVIANGHVLHFTGPRPRRQRPVLFHNTLFEGRRVFKDRSKWGGPFFQTAELGRGLALGDLDNDGWPDLVFSNIDSPVALLRNEAATAQTGDAKQTVHWLGIALAGKDHRDIVGSTLILETEGRTLTRFAKSGSSYLSSCDPRILFGLGTSPLVGRLTVKWSWGATQTWENLQPDTYWKLTEGETEAKPLLPRSAKPSLDRS